MVDIRDFSTFAHHFPWTIGAGVVTGALAALLPPSRSAGTARPDGAGRVAGAGFVAMFLGTPLVALGTAFLRLSGEGLERSHFIALAFVLAVPAIVAGLLAGALVGPLAGRLRGEL